MSGPAQSTGPVAPGGVLRPLGRQAWRPARRALEVLAVGAAIGLAACASAPPERFYRLPAPQPAAAPPATTGPVIAVGPVALPELVDRPQIVTSAAAGTDAVRVTLSETHRWAEPLRQAIGRTVAARLSVLLSAPQVVAHPHVPAGEPTFRVTLNVQRFDAELGVRVDDDVLWTVRRTSDGQTRVGRSVVSAAVAATGYEPLMAAHGEALQAVARDVAQAITGWPAPP
jgi:hypothetical protein